VLLLLRFAARIFSCLRVCFQFVTHRTVLLLLLCLDFPPCSSHRVRPLRIPRFFSLLSAKRRREAGGFPGFNIFQQQMKSGAARKRVGLLTAAPAREHTKLQTADGKEVGMCTRDVIILHVCECE
jgi:hypothetical protein